MNSNLPKPHSSYKLHRRQFWLQIFLPILVVTAIVVAVIVLTVLASSDGGESPVRWAAISTIWLIIPTLFFGLLVFILLVGISIALARLLQLFPSYSYKAQYYVNRGAEEAKRVSDLAARPVMFLESALASIRSIFKR